MEKYILAIDQGTTSTRAILFNHEREIVNVAQKELKQFYPKPSWVEQDANDIWLTSLAVIADIVMKSEIKPSQIAAIGISNQRETTIIWDKKTGLPIYHAIVWQSRQSDTICDEWKEKGYETLLKKKTGLRIDPYFSASKIVWILDHVQGARQKAENNELLFGTVDSWLVWKLSGGKVHISDVSNASRTLLFNIETCTWDDEILSLLNIPKAILPSVKPTSYKYAKTAPYLFFDEQIPITCVVGDQQAALFGQGCFKKGMAKNTYGTGGFLLMNTGECVYHSKYGLLSTIAWQIGDQITYALEGSIFVSGSLIQWLRDGLQLFNDASETEKMALSTSDNKGVVIIPAFVGLAAPYWNEKCRGSIFGLTQGVNKNHIVRAALEAMAYQSKDVLDAMEKDTQMTMNKLSVDGGAVANNFLLQFQSDLLQCEVERLKIMELTALGAASLAGLAINFWQMEDFSLKKDRIFTPQKSKEEMEQHYNTWKKAVQACMTF
ncbi:MAG: glycerol kinase [Erysipelotrichia bacterium]|nr:glycerol kinase [Erysipelotrichia bacterium]